MRYRRFGSFDWEVSVLAFGAARLPFVGGDPANLDEDGSARMIRRAIDLGVNYLDLGHPYDLRRHERVCRVVGRSLRDGYRERIRVAATLPTSLIKAAPDLDRCLSDQLGWLGMERIDYCLLGRLTRDNWPGLQEMGVLGWAEGAVRDGRIDKLGFSFHDHFQVLKAILGAYDHWALCRFQYSYMDAAHDPGVSGIKYAAAMGLPVVVAEPLRSGRLTKEPPEEVAAIWAEAAHERSLAEWGLDFVWNHGEVSTVVCDMSTMEQVEQNAAFADRAAPDSLTVQEEVLISRVKDAYRTSRLVNCPSCRPCMPCPEGIDVPRIFEIYNDAAIYRDVHTARAIYHDEGHLPGRCVDCGSCESTCAKRLPIRDWLKKAGELLE
jgi:hypothetical protein